jgi:hypothetical protein
MFGSKRPRVDLRRQGLCNVTSDGASDGADEAEHEASGRQPGRLRNKRSQRENRDRQSSVAEGNRDSFVARSR